MNRFIQPRPEQPYGQSKVTLRFLILCLAAAVITAIQTNAQQVIFSDSLDSDVADNWVVNVAPASINRATFGFDYSTVGIPPAPNSTNGTTKGLKLEANVPGGGTFTGISVSPVGQSFTNNYQLRFDLWQNFPGPLDLGGTGSTQISGGGIGTAGATAQWPGGSYDSIFFLTSGDGGSGQDYRIYPIANNASPTNGYYAAGTQVTPDSRNNSDPYYANFGNVSAPAAQLTLFPTQTKSTQVGAQGFQWHDVAITKIGNLVTWDIDGKRIGTVDLTTLSRTLGGSNIELIHSDINNGTTDAAGEPLLFALFDNVRVIQLPDSTKVSAILMDPDIFVTNYVSEADVTQTAAFNIVRSPNDLSSPVTVNFTLTGTATRGADATSGDYFIRTNGVIIPTATSVVIPANQTNVLIEIVPIDDNISELTETIIFKLAAGTNYSVDPPLGATISLVDNDAASFEISAVNYSQAFEGATNDFIRYTIERRGETNLGPFTVNLGYAGSATKDVDYISIASVNFDPTELTKTVEIHPIDDSIIETNETVILSILPGTGYAVGTNLTLTTGATGTIIDDEQPTENVLFADNFNDSADVANWTILFGSIDPTTLNYIADFGYDFSGLATFPSPPIPPAPHSTAADTTALRLSVNKTTDVAVAAGLAAGVNLYPNAKNFTGNYALRFDMYLIQGNANTTEYAMFGLNHDSTHTNWFDNSASVPAGWTYDGLFAYVEADGVEGLADGEYVLYSSPARAANNNPTVIRSRAGTQLSGVFHNPPWTSSGGSVPSNLLTSDTPSWAQVDLTQIGNLVTLKINNTVIYSLTNNTAYKSGNIMLGYDDAYNSIGGGMALYDNLRVVRLADGIHVTSVSQTATNIVLNFTGFENEPATFFKLMSSTNVTGPFADDTNSATSYAVVDPAVPSYRITTPSSAGTTNAPSARFYQIRRVP